MHTEYDVTPLNTKQNFLFSAVLNVNSTNAKQEDSTKNILHFCMVLQMGNRICNTTTRKSKKYDLATVSLNGENVISMGGLRVISDYKIADMQYENTAMFILPGGDAWERKELREIIPVIEKLSQKQIPIAAICAATTLLGDMKLLDSIKHTSNSKAYLKAISVRLRRGSQL